MTDAIPSHRLGHVPVLLDEVIALLKPRDGATYVDATFGCGGYTRALMDAAVCDVVGIAVSYTHLTLPTILRV